MDENDPREGLLRDGGGAWREDSEYEEAADGGDGAAGAEERSSRTRWEGGLTGDEGDSELQNVVAGGARGVPRRSRRSSAREEDDSGAAGLPRQPVGRWGPGPASFTPPAGVRDAFDAVAEATSATEDAWNDEEEQEDDDDVVAGRHTSVAQRRGLRYAEARERRKVALRRRLEVQPCVCESVCVLFETVPLVKSLRAAGFRPRLFTDVYHAKSACGGHAFAFLYGVIVMWGMSEPSAKALLAAARAAATEPFPAGQDKNTDALDYAYGETFGVRADLVTLSERGGTAMIEQMLACSLAVAQSMKLGMFEERVDRQIELNRSLPEQLAADGTISVSSRQLSRQKGRLFIERSEINLFSDILDTPEHFWVSNDRYMSAWKSLRAYLEVDKRERVLNRRLDVLQELLDMVGSELTDRHASRLEWIIIWLIVIEVVVELLWNVIVKDILHLVSDC